MVVIPSTDAMTREVGISEVLADLGSSLVAFHGSRTVRFARPMPLDVAEPDAVTFCRAGHPRAADLVRETRASVVICGSELATFENVPTDKAVVVVADPRLEFLRIVRRWFAEPKPAPGIHQTAVLHPEAKVDPSAYVGPGCNIGRCVVGAGSVLQGNVHLYDRVTIGKNVTIHAGAVIGGPGFGYQQNELGEWEHFPHIGGVTIEDDVEIGANTCIDRGTLADTLIRSGAKIDNLVHIAHNVVVGEHAVIIGTAQVAGSVVIGDHAWISPSATIINGVKIGRHTTIGLGSVIVKDVPDYAKTMGQPALRRRSHEAVDLLLRGRLERAPVVRGSTSRISFSAPSSHARRVLLPMDVRSL
jgi:UDP-3-O-[3-hydroxymyristoyl] glucosamine N-acyltransferase